MKTILLACNLSLALLLSACSSTRPSSDPADQAMASIHPEALRADIRFLADDALEGRQTATRGYDLAAKFMVSQFQALGLEPAGDDGTYFQTIALRSSLPVVKDISFSWTVAGKTHSLSYAKDVLVYPNAFDGSASVEAPVVLVGYGIIAPEMHHDDYQGIDVKGKIIAFFEGAPPQYESSLRAYYSSTHNKLVSAIAHGAIGCIELDDPELEKMYSFQNYANDAGSPVLWWMNKQGQPHSLSAQMKVTSFLSLPQSRAFLAAAGHLPDKVFAAKADGSLTPFVTLIRAKIHMAANAQTVYSPNVVAKLVGSDPALRDQYVVFSAHLDHLGTGVPVRGDRIYNGALDNASGSADLIEIARAMAGMSPRPRRSILFIAVTGEEEGLLGSQYFANNPTVPESSIVADVNIDEDLMLWPLEDVVVYGAEHSSLGNIANRAAARLHLVVSPDPQPEQTIFIRSDQYSFVEQGIPAIYPSAGWKSDHPAIDPKKIEDTWDTTIYHSPQDDMNQRFDWDAGVKFARYSFLCGYFIAEQTERPAWTPGDFFGTHLVNGAQN